MQICGSEEGKADEFCSPEDFRVKVSENSLNRLSLLLFISFGLILPLCHFRVLTTKPSQWLELKPQIKPKIGSSSLQRVDSDMSSSPPLAKSPLSITALGMWHHGSQSDIKEFAEKLEQLDIKEVSPSGINRYDFCMHP